MSETRPQKRAGNTATVIYNSLREDILSGKYPAGAPLPQLTIARDFGTSRGPVREALQRLQQEQLVIARANQRYNVAPFEISDFESLLSLMLLNMTIAIRVCVPLLKDKDLDEIEERANALIAASTTREIVAWETASREFCLLMVAPAGERTSVLIAHFLDNLQRYRSTILSRSPHASVMSDFPHVWRPDSEELRAVVQAARKRDAVRAASHYANYFCRLSMLILAGAAPRHDPVIFRRTVDAILGENDATSLPVLRNSA
ncbi:MULTISPECIES: GntR family transcriptional regulator [Paraburkholderia]|uniref:GntR family transcriptional regulator n=1 Tax=Paraburkholderia TaxID=1822464 RepID=UPI0038B8F125